MDACNEDQRQPGKPSMAEYSWWGFLGGNEVHAINFQKRRNYNSIS